MWFKIKCGNWELCDSIKNWMGPYPNGLRSVSCDRAIRYSGLGVRSVGPGMMSQVRFNLFMTSHLYIHLNMFFSASLSSFRKKNSWVQAMCWNIQVTLYILQSKQSSYWRSRPHWIGIRGGLKDDKKQLPQNTHRTIQWGPQDMYRCIAGLKYGNIIVILYQGIYTSGFSENGTGNTMYWFI